MAYGHPALISAAAEEPLVVDPEGQPEFNLERFKQRVLDHSKAEGSSLLDAQRGPFTYVSAKDNH